MPRVYIIILNWNGWKNTIECLESVFKIDYLNYKVVVCDNNSDDDSFERIKIWAGCGKAQIDHKKTVVLINERLILLQTGRNLGYAGGNNIGIKFALLHNADYIWILNNDTVVHHKSLTAMIESIQAISNAKLGIIGSKIMYYDEPQKVWAVSGYINSLLGIIKLRSNISGKKIGASVYTTQHVFGCSLLINCKMLSETGLIDESYFLYLEETDWMIHVRKKGWEIGVVEDSVVWHKREPKGISGMQDYYVTRNVFYLFCHNYPVSFFLAFPVLLVKTVLLKAIIRIINGKYYNVKCIFFGFVDFIRKKRGEKVFVGKVSK